MANTPRARATLRGGFLACVATLAVLTIPPSAWGPMAAANEGRRGTTLAGFVGATSATTDTRPAAFPLMSAHPVVPFASAGVGVYRAVFQTASSPMPVFYQRRMIPDAAPMGGRTFDDLVVALGAGADIFLARHLAVRPELTALLVTTRSDRRAVPVYGVQVAYHFESHPITPGVR